jgi:hypothetical protein
MFEGTRILAVSVIGLCAATLLYSHSNETKQNSADLLRTFKTIYVQSKTPLAKPQMLAGELQKNASFDAWGLSITSNPGADVVVEIDHQPVWFYYVRDDPSVQQHRPCSRQGKCMGWQAGLGQNCQGNYQTDCKRPKPANSALGRL